MYRNAHEPTPLPAKQPRDPLPAPPRGAGVRAHVAALGWAAGLGLVSGLACVGTRRFFQLLQRLIVRHGGLLPHAAALLSRPSRVAIPVLGAALATAVMLFARRVVHTGKAEGYVEAVRCDGGRVPFAATVWRTLSSSFSVATGAAIGREGSMISFATAATALVGSRFGADSMPTDGRMTLARKVACGVSAAVAAAYQAPVAGVFFVYEIVLGAWCPAQAPELAVAAVPGWLVSRWLLGPGPLFAVHGRVPLTRDLLYAVPLALLLGVLGPAYQWLLRRARALRALPGALLWGGLAVGLLSLVRPEVWGNGDVGLTESLGGSLTLRGVAAVLLLRLTATVLSTGVGTVGGVFTPSLFAGAALGFTCARLLHSPEPVLLTILAIGMFQSSVTNAPWMAAFMAVELTGQWHLLPILLPLTLLASSLSQRISPHSLYEIASSAPKND